MVWLELLYWVVFQACVDDTPAAPDMREDGAKSKPVLVRCGLEHGWQLVGGGWLRPAPHWWEVGAFGTPQAMADAELGCLPQV